jgi:hypothetical protein
MPRVGFLFIWDLFALSTQVVVLLVHVFQVVGLICTWRTSCGTPSALFIDCSKRVYSYYYYQQHASHSFFSQIATVPGAALYWTASTWHVLQNYSKGKRISAYGTLAGYQSASVKASTTNHKAKSNGPYHRPRFDRKTGYNPRRVVSFYFIFEQGEAPGAPNFYSARMQSTSKSTYP